MLEDMKQTVVARARSVITGLRCAFCGCNSADNPLNYMYGTEFTESKHNFLAQTYSGADSNQV